MSLDNEISKAHVFETVSPAQQVSAASSSMVGNWAAAAATVDCSLNAYTSFSQVMIEVFR